jgi:hypothetical protein
MSFDRSECGLAQSDVTWNAIGTARASASSTGE